MNVDPEWSLEKAFTTLSFRHTPGSLIHGRTRNLMLEVWGELVGPKRALEELDALVRKCGSRNRLCKIHRISTSSLAGLESYFAGLPQPSKKGRLSPGDRIGEWTLHRPLGRGGGSEVWRASADAFGEVALKIPNPGKMTIRRFAFELQILRELAGMKGVMPLIASATAEDADGMAWLAMPVARGILHEVADRDDPAFVLKGARSLADTLARLHARGISHRDIKPDNLYFLNREWLLADFGIASFPGKAALTQNGRKLGPVYYIAPEMLNSPQTADGTAADVYSFAKTIWVLLSGQTFPPPGEQRQSVAGLRISAYIQITNAEVLDELIDRCTRHDPSERPSAAAVATTLAQVVKKSK
jgi:eukaryotic-like serine/threonine-protein kinase